MREKQCFLGGIDGSLSVLHFPRLSLFTKSLTRKLGKEKKVIRVLTSFKKHKALTPPFPCLSRKGLY